MKPYNVKIDHFSMRLPENVVSNREFFERVSHYKLAAEIGPEAYLAIPEGDRLRIAQEKYPCSPDGFEAITMIRQRYQYNADASLVDKSIEVLQQALEEAGWDPSSLDFIIFSSVSRGYQNRDMVIPSVGCRIQEAVGARNAWAYDMQAACSGWVYPVQQATAFIQSGMAKRGAIVVTEIADAGLDYTNERSAGLIGDVATATLMSWSDEPGIFDVICEANRDPRVPSDIITTGHPAPPPHVVSEPFCPIAFPARRSQIPPVYAPFALKGKTVFGAGIREMARHARNNMATAQEGFQREPDWYVFHQANGAMLMKIIGDLGIDPARNLYNIDRLANTIGATIPSVMAEVWGTKVKPGELVSAVAFGGGVTSGRLVFRKF